MKIAQQHYLVTILDKQKTKQSLLVIIIIITIITIIIISYGYSSV